MEWRFMFYIIKAQMEGGILLYFGIAVLMMIFFYLSYRIFRSVFPRPVRTGEEEEFYQLLSDAGYALDPAQGIFYTKMNAWQRKYGYCQAFIFV